MNALLPRNLDRLQEFFAKFIVRDKKIFGKKGTRGKWEWKFDLPIQLMACYYYDILLVINIDIRKKIMQNAKLKILFILIVLLNYSFPFLVGLDEKEIKVILDSKKYFKSKLTPIVGTKNKFVCSFNHDSSFLWNYGLVIIELNEKNILFHDEFIGSDFDNVYSFKHPDIDNPIICFTDLSHRGNGCYQVFTLDNNKLVPLLFGSGANLERAWNERYLLKPIFKDKNGDGILDLVLEGQKKIALRNCDSKENYSFFYEEVFLYDKEKGFEKKPQISYDFQKKIEIAIKLIEGNYESRELSKVILFNEIQAKHFTIEQVEKMLDSEDLHRQAVSARVLYMLRLPQYNEKILNFCHKAIKIPEHEFWYDIYDCIHHGNQPPPFDEVIKGDWEK